MLLVVNGERVTMTESMTSPLDYQHDPGLFTFLQKKCRLEPHVNLPYEVHKAEQDFLEAIIDEKKGAILRKGFRNSGGTTLLCAIALYYHLISKRVIFVTTAHGTLHHTLNTFGSILVKDFDMVRCNDRKFYMRPVIGTERSLKPIDIRPYDIGTDNNRAFLGKQYDYIIFDEPPHVHIAASAEMHAREKVIINETH